ncbi:MAG: metal-sensing transcriptional repressor [Lachnospiraceae bacterium]|nr:metal-sensing transcriptional repressor [Lachnospiraceae bacterium]MDD3614685.1 metal-sensing transcriptional repressor [Lachnospiraceae bacterium]
MLELEECEAQKKDDGEIHTHTHAEGEGHVHTHVHDDGTVHAHEHTEGHGHTHSHTHTKAVVNRLSRAIGHLESIRRMVENGRDCSEVLIQLSAVKAAINNTGKVILQDHIEHCIVDAVEQGDREALDELSKAIDRFMK